jgi:L,D-transpeptidase catalytic domain
MLFRRLVIFSVIIVIAVSWLSHSSLGKIKKNTLLKSRTVDADEYLAEKKLKEKVVLAKLFVQRKDYNNKNAFFIDMSLASGKPRFYIYDLIKDSLISQGLVAHGNCFEYWLEGRRYSNVVGSGCTSLGKYKIGNSYTGKWGYSYKLHGLDSSNNNAFERTVVLHSHSCIPESETEDEICQSNGCPTVSPNFLEQLKTIINTSKKPVLLWIYE